jgi:hypothetical protein
MLPSNVVIKPNHNGDLYRYSNGNDDRSGESGWLIHEYPKHRKSEIMEAVSEKHGA